MASKLLRDKIKAKRKAISKYFQRIGKQNKNSIYADTNFLEEYYKQLSKEKDYLSKRYKEYILIPEQYWKMARDQNYKCAICKQEETAKSNNKEGLPKALSIDHCHETKKVRGLLCTRCNSGLGLFKDKVENLQQAIEYLLKSNK